MKKPDVLTGEYFVQGNFALAEGAIAAGCRFYSAYPITPASSIAERMALRMPQVGGIFIQLEDEISSLMSVIGASWAGVKAMTATSGPGLSLMVESIGLAIMTETPCVIADMMRGGPSTGQPTKPSQQDVLQVRWAAHGDYEIITLAPYSVQEMFDLTIKAFNLAEKFRVPCFILADEIIAHTREKLVIPEPEKIKTVDRKKPKVPPEEYLPFKPDEDLVPPMSCFGEGYRFYATGLTHDESGHPDMSAKTQRELTSRLCEKIRKNKKEIITVEKYFLDDAETVIIAFGTPARAAKETVKIGREKGLKVGLLRLITVWPFPEEEVAKIVSEAKLIIVPEMNQGQIIREVKAASSTAPIISFPKVGEEPPTPNEILKIIEKNTS